MSLSIQKRIILAIVLGVTIFFSYFLITNAQEPNATNSTVVDGQPGSPVSDQNTSVLSTQSQNKIIALANGLDLRMEFHITKIENLVGRLEQRIEKVQQAGFNTKAVEAKLLESDPLIRTAKIHLNGLETVVFGVTTASDPKSEWVIARQHYLETDNLIRDSYQILFETVELLKLSVLETNTTISSTTTASSSPE